jgi:hypothetical protein
MKRSKKKWLGAPKRDAGPPLVCYALAEGAPAMRPAPHTRAWMDATPDGFAYRCLPLAIANAHAWEVLNPIAFEAKWDGSPRGGIVITSPDGRRPPATDHFGSGILTFHVNALFRTSPGTNLWVMGPTNQPKHGIAPLTAVVETDWSPATFTMNWKFTAPDVTVRFEEGEPYCAFFPVPRGTLDRIEPRIESIEAGGRDFDEYADWSDARGRFLKELNIEGTEAHERGWEKAYFQGRHPDGRRGPQDHQTKLRLKPFVEMTKRSSGGDD